MITRRTLAGLALGCHPAPTAAVTLAIAGLAAAAGRDAAGVGWVAAAVLAGQLSIGWCNDARDAGRDAAAGRQEKPTVRGWITARTLAVAAGIALAACVPLSFVAGGAVGGFWHVAAVASAWLYDLALKTTRWSWLPFAFSFGAVPAFITYGLTPPVPPPWWLTAAAALIGVGAHLANGVPDIAGDVAVDAGGATAALGGRAARALAAGALLAATALLLPHTDWARAAQVLVFAAMAAVVGAAAVVRAGTRLFEAILVLALVDVGLLVVGVSGLTG